MTLAFAQVPRLVNVIGTWQILAPNQTVPVLCFLVAEDAKMKFAEATSSREVFFLDFNGMISSLIRYTDVSGNTHNLQWSSVNKNFAGAGHTLTPPEGFQMVDTYDMLQAVDFKSAVGTLAVQQKTITWTGALAGQSWVSTNTLTTNITDIELSLIHI